MSHPVESHNEKVAAVQTAIRQARGRKTPVKVFHGSSNSTRPFSAGRKHVIDVSSFTDVLEVNEKGSYAWVEPNVPLDKLVDAVISRGLVPPMVAEFPGITVGGAIQGGSAESSSFKHGCFHDICLEYEVVLGDSSVVNVSANTNPELFFGLACGFGSLGILTNVKLRLVPATRYVRLTYQRADGIGQAIELLKAATKERVDFVDAIIFSRSSASVMTGAYVDDADLPRATFHSAFDDWFYLHAERVTQKHKTYEEIIPLRDYLFRYDRGAFWAAKYGFQDVPFNRITRTMFAGLMNTRTLYKLLQGSNYAYEYMTQDLCMPQETIGELIEFCNGEYDIMPLWLCPLKPGREDKLAPNAIKTELVINLGLWGPMKPSTKDALQRNRELEQEVSRLGGRKVLYAHAYYPEDEFWQIYNERYYLRLRKLTKSEGVFPDLYRKTRTPPAFHQPSRRRGFLALLRSPYRLK